MSSKLEQLKQHTIIVADTGDLHAIQRLQPQDATTNPSLLLKAAALEPYQALIESIKQKHATDLQAATEAFAVAVGSEIVQQIPGRISTEVDARLSFDTEATYQAALRLIAAYQAAGVEKARVLIKIAATWEGVKAAERLEQQGIQTNLTLIFSMAQAIACAEAGVYLISPFVGRIYDWHKKRSGIDYQGAEDPGVQSVSRIYQYYKQHQYPTIVMGASFRNIGQIEQLVGCDRLTISPELIEQLAAQCGELTPQLTVPSLQERPPAMTEAAFRWAHNEDAMATEKLAEGIRQFAQDQIKLEALFS